MNAKKQMEQSQDSERKKTSLDRRYGKIGISAVAAAVQPKAEQPQRGQAAPHSLRERLSAAAGTAPVEFEKSPTRA